MRREIKRAARLPFVTMHKKSVFCPGCIKVVFLSAQLCVGGDQLVGFGAHAKSTWQEIWNNRADGYASFILWATCVPGTRMYKLQQYLRNQMQSACPQLLSQRVSCLFFASVKELFAVVSSSMNNIIACFTCTLYFN
ncbi:hypothetical protein Q7C36_018006 [Tachysurus vachellii]|uniref:Uncharacterized protein n=1 Tax=Tachysurus vachellii TaxID=175792 RepID=A0AA88S2S1_TACVA|nr:hypothetical protein Q7C36_018006 [Tachysurus vachellii]